MLLVQSGSSAPDSLKTREQPISDITNLVDQDKADILPFKKWIIGLSLSGVRNVNNLGLVDPLFTKEHFLRSKLVVGSRLSSSVSLGAGVGLRRYLLYGINMLETGVDIRIRSNPTKRVCFVLVVESGYAMNWKLDDLHTHFFSPTIGLSYRDKKGGDLSLSGGMDFAFMKHLSWSSRSERPTSRLSGAMITLSKTF